MSKLKVLKYKNDCGDEETQIADIPEDLFRKIKEK